MNLRLHNEILEHYILVHSALFRAISKFGRSSLETSNKGTTDRGFGDEGTSERTISLLITNHVLKT